MHLRVLQRFKRVIATAGDEAGLSLIEIVIIMVILGIAVGPLSSLSVKNLESNAKYVQMTKALIYAQQRMEEIIADYAAVDEGRGYDWVRTNWNGDSDIPISGLSRSVSISGEQSLNGSNYVVVQVTVGSTEIDNVVLTTWLVGM